MQRKATIYKDIVLSVDSCRLYRAGHDTLFQVSVSYSRTYESSTRARMCSSRRVGGSGGDRRRSPPPHHRGCRLLSPVK